MPLVKVSVVVVTYNRHDDCKKTVESLLAQSVQPHEIIVVDDCSFIPFRYDHVLAKVVRNDRELGLSGSRNVGIQVSNGDVIAFIDDDALATQNWVKTVCRAFGGDVDVVGGPVLPLYLKRPPKWWSHEKFGLLVGISNELIIGCNFAVRKALFDDVGYFNTWLGRRYGTLLSGEEEEFFRRASKVEAKFRFIPEMVVYHRVYPFRLTMIYLLRRSWWGGVTGYLTSSLAYKRTLRKIGRMVSCLLKVILFPKNSRRWILTFTYNFGFLFAMLKFKRGQEIHARSEYSKQG